MVVVVMSKTIEHNIVMTDKVFSDEAKARAYINLKNKDEDGHHYYFEKCEMV